MKHIVCGTQIIPFVEHQSHHLGIVVILLCFCTEILLVTSMVPFSSYFDVYQWQVKRHKCLFLLFYGMVCIQLFCERLHTSLEQAMQQLIND